MAKRRFNLSSIRPLLGATMLLVASTTLAIAEQYDSISTPAQRAACRPDVFRLCAAEIPSVPAITACMRRKKASLSEACRAVFEK